ncbi:MAG TPA: ATP-binding protein, partial [Acidimicrobiia bacterium]|nr:ATP-binding protein [Acidimicrobiia bacterium]
RGWSLRAQLAVALVASVALFGAAAALLTARSYHDDRAAAGRQLATLARAAASKLDSQVAQSEQVLAGIAAQDAITALDPGRCGLVLGGFRGLGPGYLALVGPDGDVLCSSRPAGELTPAAFAAAGWVADARRAGRAVHAEPVADPVTQRPMMVLATPVPAAAAAGTAPAGKRPPAVLAAVLDLDGFAPDLVGPLDADRGTVVAAVDAAGSTVLFRNPGHYAGRPITTGNPGTSLFQAKGFDGVERIFRAVTAPQLGWHVYAGTPVSVAFAAAHRTVAHSIALTLVVFCMLALLTGLLTRRVVRPARALADAIVAARAGDDAPRAPEEGPAELARVAAEFNALQAARAAEEAGRRAADAELAERVAELGEARAELRRALVRFTELQEDERRSIAQAVHDQTIQALIATMWALDDLDAEETSPHVTAVLDRARENLSAAVGAARSLLFELRPPALDELGLGAALEQQLDRLGQETGIAVAFDNDVQGRLPLHVETLAFRTAQEALRNVRQHASARSARVAIRRYDDRLEVDVDDDGVGVRPADLVASGPARAGIVGMREAVGMHGGTFAIGPRPAGGTRVSFSLPLAGPSAA